MMLPIIAQAAPRFAASISRETGMYFVVPWVVPLVSAK